MTVKHLKFIDSLACIACGAEPTHHHLLRVSPDYYPVKSGEEDFLIPKKKSKGMATKNDDRFVIPLCNKHHQMLHLDGNERYFLRCLGVSQPEELALYLYKHSGDRKACMRKIKELRLLNVGI